jgi:hypothetical protein
MLSRVTKTVSALSRRALAAVLVPTRAEHTLPGLDYDYGALEPHISAEIMQIHHSKHHATYVNNLNIAEEKYAEAQAKGTARLQFNLCGLANTSVFQTVSSLQTVGSPMLKNEIVVRITSHQNMYLTSSCIYQLDSDTLVSPKLQLYQLSSLIFDAICYLICQGC